MLPWTRGELNYGQLSLLNSPAGKKVEFRDGRTTGLGLFHHIEHLLEVVMAKFEGLRSGHQDPGKNDRGQHPHRLLELPETVDGLEEPVP